LVIEISTLWPAEFDDLDPREKQRIERAVHADPQRCSHLDYIRQHTGFCRQITVTPEDIERVASAV
jgi:hypothetical protein